MATFTSLHHVALVLSDRIAEATGVTAQVGAPLETPHGGTEESRVTLMWTTPQPTHRNDPFERNPDGTLQPPPLTLAAYLLVTTYGTNADDPIGAYSHLGTVLRLFHSEPVLQLPLPFGSGEGTGRLTVTQVPTAADLMEKVYTPLQTRHRPWALFEVGPVQLPHFAAAGGEVRMVKPGGARLVGVEAIQRPAIRRVIPAQSGVGLRIRVEADYAGTVLRAHVGGVRRNPADLSIPEPGGPILTVLPTVPPDAIGPGSHNVTLTVGNVTSAAVPFQVAAPNVPTLSAPDVLVHSRAATLTLVGQALGDATAVVMWPDAGIDDPVGDVKELAVTNVSAGSVDVDAAELAAAEVGVLYRVAVRLLAQLYTPWVLLELEP